MDFMIIADSGCDLTSFPECENILFERAPLTVRVGEKEYTDDFNLDIDSFMADMEGCTTTTGSSAPNPEVWYEAYKKADNVFAITITSSLSGSYRSAMAAKDMILEEFPDKNVHVIDTLSAGPELTLILYKLVDYIKEGMSFDSIVKSVSAYQNDTGLAFMLESLDNLVRNGRVNKFVGKAVGMLGIKIVGRASEKGELEVVHKARRKATEQLVQLILNDGFKGGRIIISHCQNETGAESLKEYICMHFPYSQVEIMPTSGLCSYYAESRGMLVGFEKTPA